MRLIDQKYINIEMIIPNRNDDLFELSKAFINALDNIQRSVGYFKKLF